MAKTLFNNCETIFYLLLNVVKKYFFDHKNLFVGWY